MPRPHAGRREAYTVGGVDVVAVDLIRGRWRLVCRPDRTRWDRLTRHRAADWYRRRFIGMTYEEAVSELWGSA